MMRPAVSFSKAAASKAAASVAGATGWTVVTARDMGVSWSVREEEASGAAPGTPSPSQKGMTRRYGNAPQKWRESAPNHEGMREIAMLRTSWEARPAQGLKAG
ncbi:hypothetical protein GCM10007967_14710 [Xylanimonas ulmi]